MSKIIFLNLINYKKCFINTVNEKMTKNKILLLALTLTLASFTVHKYYISLIKVEYKKESKSVQITMRIFIDDLQQVLKKTYDKNIELEENNELIFRYVKDNFSVKINNTKRSYLYLGKEYENDVVFLYLEVKNIETIQSIEIQNSMLMSTFPEQKNIIKLNINNIKKTFLLTAEENKDILSF